MKSCEFSVRSIQNHRRGIHMPDVRLEGRELVMFGRSIPVVDREQLEDRLVQIGCDGEVIEEIVGNLFGFALRSKVSLCETVASEAPIALTEVIEDFV